MLNKIHQYNVLQTPWPLEDNSIDCCVTSPPYWALRLILKLGVVLDCFMGAGTTALVARKLNRNYVGFELNPEYIKIAEKRLKKELGMFQ